MRDYVLDANAALRFLNAGPGGERVNDLIEQASRGETRLSMSVINFGEVYYDLLRRTGESAARHAIAALREVLTEIAEVDEAQALEAGALKVRYKLGYADAFASLLAISMSATLVSADPAFQKLGRKLKLMRLPRHVD